ncbi:translation initiation factor IF-3 [Patescibacteria group bacterium]|nr:translation initiation factor IF-3 [Patescibacteria group bacterium]
MRKSYKFKRKIRVEKKYFSNYQIRARELNVIDEMGSPLGIMPTPAAVELAQEKGLDLVEVAPRANPPVAKIMDFGSFQYQREKQLKKQKKLTKTTEVKNIRLSIKISDHDKETKAKQAEKFLAKDNKIKIELILRGREMQYMGIARKVINDFVAQLTTPTIVEQDISKQGNKLFIILMPAKTAN